MVCQLFIFSLILATISLNVSQKPFYEPNEREQFIANYKKNIDMSNLRKMSRYNPNRYRTSTGRIILKSTKRFYDAFKTIRRRVHPNQTTPNTIDTDLSALSSKNFPFYTRRLVNQNKIGKLPSETRQISSVQIQHQIPVATNELENQVKVSFKNETKKLPYPNKIPLKQGKVIIENKNPFEKENKKIPYLDQIPIALGKSKDEELKASDKLMNEHKKLFINESKNLSHFDKIPVASNKSENLDQMPSESFSISKVQQPDVTMDNKLRNIIKNFMTNTKKNFNTSIQNLLQETNFNSTNLILPKFTKVFKLKSNQTLLKLSKLSFRNTSANIIRKIKKPIKTNLTIQENSTQLSSSTNKSQELSPEYLSYLILYAFRKEVTNLTESTSDSSNSLINLSPKVPESSNIIQSKISNFNNKSINGIHFIEAIEDQTIILPSSLPKVDFDLTTPESKNITEKDGRNVIKIDIRDNVNLMLIGQPLRINDRNEFQMVVLLVGYRNREIVEKFTGTLVAPHWIITAASSAKEDMIIYARSPNCLENTCYNEHIHKVIHHPEYREIEDEENNMKLYCNNIALLKLRNPWNYKINYAEMPNKFMQTRFHQLFQSCLSVNYDGYLFLEKQSNKSENHLNKMRVTVLHPARYCTHMGFCENDECSSLYSYAYTMSSSIDNGICTRDVGSPLFCRSNNKWFLMAVRSTTNGCHLGFRYAGSSYTRVDSYSLWINYTLGINPPYQSAFPYY